MKFKRILITSILLSAFTAGHARADQFCSLQVNPSSYIQRGQTFSYGIDIVFHDFGPTPPGGWPPPPYTIVFHGSNNAEDIPPGGEPYPGTFTYGHSELTGYQNPASGGFSGTYVRWADVKDSLGRVYCVTNAIVVVLE